MIKRTDLGAIKADWETLQEGAAAIQLGDTPGLKAVNARLGYSVVKSIPGLLQAVQNAEEATVHHLEIRRAVERRADGLQGELKKALSTIKERDATIRDMNKAALYAEKNRVTSHGN